MIKEIPRTDYLNTLISKKENDLIKIITGIRRCGKSYLLDPLFKNHLIKEGVKENHIIKLELDSFENKKYTEPQALYDYVMSKIKDNNTYYILLDEIQKVDDFESILNSFLRKKNLDVYVTGSNSKFLSKDIITEFRGRGDEIRVYPLSFSEFISAYDGNIKEAFKDYITYGGMPDTIKKSQPEKAKYLNNLFENTYLNDIIERNNILKDEVLDTLINIVASSVGSLTNAFKIANTFVSKGFKDVSNKTINSYLNYLLDSFLIEKVERYDIKGKNYIASTCKYYFTDIGLRNAKLGFRQIEENHLMENIIYIELLRRGFNVDVGVVEHNIKENNKSVRKQLEVDFVCNMGSKRYYIQSAFAIPNEEKLKQEENSLLKINDAFKKIIILKDNLISYTNEEGILIIGLEEFLLNKNSLEL
jgi:predicted AAA+ superfamily ATPase